ncbi:GEVED domain-containing protein [Empedobacter tilapiae]|uniref:T9SS type A sorting domain-containing protein n=1 Tax=Empedobacter tilapiae TaxID=2491114 RepID=A0A4Z1BQX4_9FLAO|nr:GEVED domain-containing protein [Empedobacter tilapiae]TGN24545.1 T9SS type A sorting domain-containing protein [Empedobacter tilapiae]
MKKILLLCSMALGIGANAQISVKEGFETTLPTTWVGTGGFTPANYTGVYNNAGCTGVDRAWGAALVGTAASGKTATLTYTKPAAMVANGKQIDINFDYIIEDFLQNNVGELKGNILVQYSTDAAGTTFTTVSTIPYSGTTGECVHVTASIPDGLINGSNFKFRVSVTSTSANNTNGALVFLDNISIVQNVDAIPSCTTLSAPADGATDVFVRPTFTWGTATNAHAYKLYLGSVSATYNAINGEEQSSGYMLPAAQALAANTKYFAKIVATNNLGDAVGCVETTFTTGENSFAPYCGPIISTIPAQMFPIKSFKFGDVEKISDEAATTFGTYEAHQNFTATKFEINDDVTSVPFTLSGIGSGSNNFATVIYIDWNEDGDFDDAGEAYFNTAGTMLVSNVVTGGLINLKGDLSIPADVKAGEKRMRVKYNFTGATAIHNSLSTACSDVGNGQVEEYTIKVKSTALTYCDAQATSTNNDYERIVNVKFADIDNASTPLYDNNGYEDFTNIVGNVQTNKGYPIEVKIANFSGDKTSIWIDYNQDGVFTDDEKTNMTVNAATSTGLVKIPSNAKLGKTRMRVRTAFLTDPQPCGNNTFGQVEDYTIDIQEGVASVPDCTTITVPSNGAVDVATSSKITWNVVSDANKYKIYIGTASGTYDIEDGKEVTETNYNVSLSASTKYFVKVVASNDTGDASGCEEISFTTASNYTYCNNGINMICSDGDVIENVTFAGINKDSSCSGTTGYSDFTSLVAEVSAGETYPISVKVGPSGDGWLYESVGVWIDFNQNGSFEESEYTYVGTGLAQVLTKNIVIPSDAKMGPTRMRVVLAASKADAFGHHFACGPNNANEAYGEMEDYTVNVGKLGVSDMSKTAISIYPNPFKDVLRISDVKDAVSIVVTDLSGRTLVNMKPATELNLSTLSKGVYIVTIKYADGSTKTTKVVKN